MINILLALSLCADWSPRLTADYLDSREKEWFSWSRAQTPGGPCVSCHTNVTYLLVRPELRRKLGETQPTTYETGLRKSLHSAGFSEGFFAKEPLGSQATGVQAIHSALFLGDETALGRMWSLQTPEGSWKWFHLDLDPWETPESTFYAATLAALAVGNASADHRARHREQIALLTGYLQREQAMQPLHNRLMLLWASEKMPEILPDRQSLLEEIWSAQQPDGGWSIASLGPWKRPSRSTGSDAYATGLTAYVLLKDHNKGLEKALNWLKSHQNEAGFWPSQSMNKEYPPDSMMAKFMQDAATGFAALALLEAER